MVLRSCRGSFLRRLFIALLVSALSTLVLRGRDAVDVADGLQGIPYGIGGEGPDYFDCSGLVFYAYDKLGVHLRASGYPRGTINLASVTYRVSGPSGLAALIASGSLQRNDLLFFDSDGTGISHVGIYVGGTTMIHADADRGVTSTQTLTSPYWTSKFLFATRITPPTTVSSAFDGHWTGHGSGQSAGGTPATFDVDFDVVGGQINNLVYPWRIDTLPGTTQSAFCGGTGQGGGGSISGDSVQISAGDNLYTTGIDATFHGSSVSGAVAFVKTANAAPWCLNATIVWNGSRR